MVDLPLSGKDEITKLVPQRMPMLMFDSFLEADDQHAISELTISEDNIFYDEIFTVPGIIEHIAQTAAAHNGFISLQRNQPVRLGYIAAVKNLKIFELPAVGDKLQTEIKIVNEVMGFVVVEGKVRTDHREIASCEMNIFISKDNES